MLGCVVFSTLRTFLADNAGIALPLGIERVIWIGSKDFTFLSVVSGLGPGFVSGETEQPEK